MDEVRETIKGYVLVIDPSITDDDYLDFIVADIVDRFLVYTNRAQFVAQYEEDIADPSVDEDDYVLPVPTELQRTIARTIVEGFKTAEVQLTADTGAVVEVTDHDQKVRYSENLRNYFSGDDAKVFGSALTLYDKFRVPTIVENPY